MTRAPNDRVSYRVSAGYFTSDAFARPTGRIPVIDDPRQPGQTVGGAFYPLDSAAAAFGTGFANRGTSQPKFDVRVDQELSHGTLTYAGGVAGTDGLIHSGIGPFDMQSGTYLGYGKLTYTRGALRMQFFTNVLNGQAPNLLLPDLATGRPLQLDFRTQTYDGEIGHSVFLGTRHRLTYGGNVRQNNFDITLAPRGENRLEVGAYLQDEIFWERFRLVLGGRVDKFGNLSNPKFPPRIAFLVKPAENHSITLSYNRAFRAPSFINNALQTNIVSPVDLSALAPLLPPGLQPAVAQPFPLVVAGVGSDIPIGGMPQDTLTEESLTAYEVSYAGVLPRGTTLGGSFFVNRRDDAINFTALPPSLDPYTATHPSPGWRLPPGVLTQLAQFGIFLPRTAFTYLNLGPIRQTGVELWLEQRVSRAVAASINYSWQSEPEILDDPNPHLPAELNLPPTHRFNAGVTWNGSRLLVPSHARWQPQRRLWQPNVDGMRVAVAGPYGHERVTAWQDGADAQRKNTAGGFVSSGRARAPGRRPRPPVANDRSRHRLIGSARVSKADGSQSRDLQRCGPRASTPATSTTTSPPASATTARDSTAACARSGRATCSSSGSSTASVVPSLTWSTPCRTCRPAAWACGCSPGKARRSTPPPPPAASYSASSRRWPSSSGS